MIVEISLGTDNHYLHGHVPNRIYYQKLRHDFSKLKTSPVIPKLDPC